MRPLFIGKLDLLKGYWVPLTDKAKEISAFIILGGHNQYTVTPFRIQNSSAMFQKLIHQVIKGKELKARQLIWTI